MKISPVFITNSQAAKIAWDYCENEPSNTNKNLISNIDHTANEFAKYHLQIESTFLERELFSSLPGCTVYEQKITTQDVLDFKTTDHFSKFHQFFTDLRRDIFSKAKAGEVDFWKMLPAVSIVKYSVSISARDLIRVYLYTLYLESIIKNKYIRQLLRGSGESISKILAMAGYKDLTGYKMVSILENNYQAPRDREITTAGNFTLATSLVPLYSRSKVLSNKRITFSDDFIEIFNSEVGHLLSIQYHVEISIAGRAADVFKITENKNIWNCNKL